MKRSIQVCSVAACFCFSAAFLPLAAQTSTTASPGEKNVSFTKPAEKCLSDLQAFDGQMEKDGYWLSGSGYGYGYPTRGYGYPTGGYPETTAISYQNARPGYEVRILLASANILARNGQQQSCEGVLATTREIYKRYVVDMQSGKVPRVDVPAWRQLQIDAAQPVANNKSSFRSDELVGTDVRNAKNVVLGSVDDLVMNPQTGKIAYLVISRGGIFGIGEKYVPVPWSDFKVTANMSLLVLDSTKAAMDGAPQVSHDQFSAAGHFEQQSEKVDAYWKTHLSSKGSN